MENKEIKNYIEEVKIPQPGKITKGKIISISSTGVFIDIGCKSEGVIKLEEFMTSDGDINIFVGQEIDVLIEKINSGQPFLSYQKCKGIINWENLKYFHKNFSSFSV